MVVKYDNISFLGLMYKTRRTKKVLNQYQAVRVEMNQMLSNPTMTKKLKTINQFYQIAMPRKENNLAIMLNLIRVFLHQQEISTATLIEDQCCLHRQGHLNIPSGILRFKH